MPVGRPRRFGAGAVVGLWTVLERLDGDRCRCRCVCGVERVVNAGNLRNGTSQSCGCRRYKLGTPLVLIKLPFGSRSSLPPGEAARRRVIGHYKRNATDRMLLWELSDSVFFELVALPCHYCGTLPSREEVSPSGVLVYNGLDRLDNSLGYTQENTVPCCFRCNHAKSDLSLEDFLLWIERLKTHTTTR